MFENIYLILDRGFELRDMMYYSHAYHLHENYEAVTHIDNHEDVINNCKDIYWLTSQIIIYHVHMHPCVANHHFYHDYKVVKPYSSEALLFSVTT